MNLLKLFLKPAYILVCRLFSVPSEQGEAYESFVFGLVEHKSDITLTETERSELASITDERIIYLKGETPEQLVEVDGKMVPRRGSILEKKYYYIKMTQFIRKQAGRMLGDAKLLDVGATDSLLFDLLGKKGKGVNVSEGAIQRMKDGGVEAEYGSAEDLPYKDQSYDIVLCLNTLGHLENPILAMRELKRVAKGAIFVSMGDSHTLRFLPNEYENGQHRWNKFSFTHDDFLKLADYVGLKVIAKEQINTFAGPRDFKDWLFQLKWRQGKSYWIFALEDNGVA